MEKDTFISIAFWLLSIGQSLDRLVLFHDFHQSSLQSNNLGDIGLSYNSTTISLLPMINGTLIKDIGKKDIGAFCCYSLVIQNYTYNIGEKCTGVFHPVPQRILKTSFFSFYSHRKIKEKLRKSFELLSNIK